MAIKWGETGLRKPSMLVVDDVMMNRAVLNEIFQEDYTIYEAENGVQALEILRNNDTQIDIVLLDIFMPQMNGFEVLEIMRDDDQLRNIPVMANTAFGEEETVIKALELGAVDCISKPYDVAIVARRVHNIVEMLNGQKFRYDAEHDALTAIYNKQAFYRNTTEMLYQDQQTQYVLLCWNIERFMLINDLFGTQMGDRELITLAKFFEREFESLGSYGRLEADHFATCLPLELLDIEALLSRVEHCFDDLEINYNIIVNIGVYVVEAIDIPVEMMCDRANMALRTIKGNYLKHYAIYEEALRETLIDEQQITSEMDAALEEGQFVIYLQPIYSIASGAPVSAEALVRWIHPQKGLIPPTYSFRCSSVTALSPGWTPISGSRRASS